MNLSEHDLKTFKQTANAVVRYNKHMRERGYTTDEMLTIMLNDARRFMAECKDKDDCGYASTRGYVLSTYYFTSGYGETLTRTMSCYASVNASLFDE